MTSLFPRATDKDLIDSGWTLDKAFLEEVKSATIAKLYYVPPMNIGSIEILLLTAEKVLGELQ